jgi:hypothetical protein
MRIPSTLRLPFWARARFRIEQIIASQLDCSWSVGWELREMFALGGPEVAFARALLARRTNLWLFRTNQRHFCGDFLAVDMSARRDRRVHALELKMGEPLRHDVGGIQFGRLDEAIAELAPLVGAGTVTTAQGDGDAILHWLRAD